MALKLFLWYSDMPDTLDIVFTFKNVSILFVFFIYFLFFFNPHPRTCILILERRGGIEREGEKHDVRQKHQLVASCLSPDQGPNPRLRHVL